MDIQTAFRNYALLYQDIQDLIFDRLFPSTASQEYQLPYVVYERLSVQPLYNWAGETDGIDKTVMRITIYSHSTILNAQIEKAFRERLSGFQGQWEDQFVISCRITTISDENYNYIGSNDNPVFAVNMDMDIRHYPVL
jgi:hypothetical protein